MPYNVYGLATLHELMGDLIVYRNLVPADERLPAVTDLRDRLGLAGTALPRKAEPAYGQVVAEILRQARRLDLPGAEVQRIIYFGDTRMNDGTAFRNLCAAGQWPGWAFIGRDDLQRPAEIQVDGSVFSANRWSALTDFQQLLADRGFRLDEGTAVVIDIDKTALGPRGRNDKVIDEARVAGVRRTVASLLGPDFDEAAFRVAYDELNQQIYHPFTADNQDYLAYICLMLGAGLFDLDGLIHQIETGAMTGFASFIQQVQDRHDELAGTGLTQVHDEVWHCVRAGDPTPFKAFRYNEYLTTVARFGDLPGATVEQILAERITINQEVREAAAFLEQSGALIFGVSDKPDEASLPNPKQVNMGMKPLHRIETLAVGVA